MRTRRTTVMWVCGKGRQIVGTKGSLIDLRDIALVAHDHWPHMSRCYHPGTTFKADTCQKLECLPHAIPIFLVHFVVNDRMIATKKNAAAASVAELNIGQAQIRELSHHVAMVAAESPQAGGIDPDRDNDAFA